MKKFTYSTLIAAVTLIVSAVFYIGCIENTKSNISSNLLRLHIVGADNSELSQDLKLKVRDRILADYSDAFAKCSSAEESAALAESLIPSIKASAERELAEHGCFEKVRASVEKCRFPTKSYGTVSLPGGIYTALNLKIGRASGRNWWCVMYPPLCLTNGNALVPDSSNEALKSVLSAEEYELITSSSTDIKIKFKIAEILGKYFK